MANKEALVNVSNGKMTITINRPEDENRINMEATTEIYKAITLANDSPDIKVIILTGNKEYFCSGGRIEPDATEERRLQYTNAIKALQESMVTSKVPIIAALEGSCRAGGNDLLAAADIAVARKGISFSFPEILHGGFPAMVMIKVMDIIPKKKLLPLFYTGGSISVEEAAQMSMVTCVVEEDAFWETVDYYADEICDKSEVLISLGRKAYHEMLELNMEKRTEYASGFLARVLKEQLK